MENKNRQKYLLIAAATCLALYVWKQLHLRAAVR